MPFSPPHGYLQNVTIPNLERFGITINCSTEARGLMPVGGGRLDLSADPVAVLRPVQLTEQGIVTTISVHVQHSQHIGKKSKIQPGHILAQAETHILSSA